MTITTLSVIYQQMFLAYKALTILLKRGRKLQTNNLPHFNLMTQRESQLKRLSLIHI